jgi:hypothetical protein
VGASPLSALQAAWEQPHGTTAALGTRRLAAARAEGIFDALRRGFLSIGFTHATGPVRISSASLVEH